MLAGPVVSVLDGPNETKRKESSDDQFVATDEGGYVTLNEAQCKQLSKVLYHLESEVINHRPFGSESDCRKELDYCKDAHEHVLKNLDFNDQEMERHANNAEVQSQTANELFTYTTYLLDFSMECIRSSCMRLEHLKNIRKAASDFSKALEATPIENLPKLRSMAKEVYRINKEMLDHNKMYHSDLPRVFTEDIVKHEHACYEHYEFSKRPVTYNSASESVTLPFAPLEKMGEGAEREVLKKIVNPREFTGSFSKGRHMFTGIAAVAGTALIGASIATAAFDISTSDEKLQTAANDGFSVASGIAMDTLLCGSKIPYLGIFASAVAAGLMATDICVSQDKAKTAEKDCQSLVSSFGTTIVAGIATEALVGLIGATSAIATCGISILVFAVVSVGAYFIGKSVNEQIDEKYKAEAEAKAKAEAEAKAKAEAEAKAKAETEAKAKAEAKAMASIHEGIQLYMPKRPDGRALACQIVWHT